MPGPEHWQSQEFRISALLLLGLPRGRGLAGGLPEGGGKDLLRPWQPPILWVGLLVPRLSPREGFAWGPGRSSGGISTQDSSYLLHVLRQECLDAPSRPLY